MVLKFGFAGFRHNHVYSILQKVNETNGTELVAACEENRAARAEAVGNGVKMTHDRFEDLMEDANCDVVVVGAYFAARGPLALRALNAGKHVLVDKPVCTDLAELAEIERLAGENGLKVGCTLEMRDSAPTVGLRDLIRSGTIGDVNAISFGGQHPLNRHSRPGWYFEPGKHGGTINDIAIHGIDAIPWMTGLQFSVLNAARCWNALVPEHPDFKEGAQMMLTMDNGCGVLGDVSYFMPSGGGYSLPFYWRWTIFGSKGILETSWVSKEITVALDGVLETRPVPEVTSGGYFEGFVRDIRGETIEEDLDTATVIKSSRTTLLIQNAADEGAHTVSLLDA